MKNVLFSSKNMVFGTESFDSFVIASTGYRYWRLEPVFPEVSISRDTPNINREVRNMLLWSGWIGYHALWPARRATRA